jgi:hypothetical protein
MRKTCRRRTTRCGIRTRSPHLTPPTRSWPGRRQSPRAPGGKLGSLVINCHGYEVKSGGGYGLQLGAGIQRRHTALFRGLKGLLSEIHIVACKAAQISDPGTSGDGDGNLFCCEIAKNAGVNVYASTAMQTPGLWNDLWGIPYGKIDDYEGDVYRWRPDGSCQLVRL